MEGLINSGGLNSLNFEHTYLLDPRQAEFFLINLGFSIIKKKKYLDHSYFYQVVKDRNILPGQETFPNIQKLSQEFLEMVSSLKDFALKANNIIDLQTGPVYLFGAHIFAQSLLFFGLQSMKVSGILDNSVEKQDKRLYGTKLNVYDPSIISKDVCPVVVLNASHYQDEIKQQLLSLNSNVVIIENL
jgi:hypothetical protein